MINILHLQTIHEEFIVKKCCIPPISMPESKADGSLWIGAGSRGC